MKSYELEFWIRMKKKANICFKRGSQYTNCILLEQGLLFIRGKALLSLMATVYITKEATSPKI